MSSRWTRQRAVAPLLGLAAYVCAYGLAIIKSIDVLLHGYGSTTVSHASQRDDVRTPVLASCLLVVALTLASMAVRLVGAPQCEWLIGTTPARRGRGIFTVGALMLSSVAGVYLVADAGAAVGPTNPVHHALWFDLVFAVTQGALGEELLVLALPLVLIRHAAPHVLERRSSIARVVAVGVALRLAYHLYQGVWSLSHILWAAAAIVLYLWSGRVWPQIIAHALYDVVAVLWNHDAIGGGVQWLALIAFPLVLVILGAVVIARRQAAADGLAGPSNAASF